MNVSLMYVNPPESLWDRLRENREIMGRLPEIHIEGDPILVPIDQAVAPGAFAVWWPLRVLDDLRSKGTMDLQFGWVDIEGVLHLADAIPREVRP